MERLQKISLLQTLSSEQVLRTEMFYKVLEECGDMKFNYCDYMTTHPVDCRQELLRLSTADYETCCALLTMLLREDYFTNGSFEQRQHDGEVKPIVDRMLLLLKETENREFLNMEKILLDDLLRIPPDIVGNVKIRFNQHNGSEDPMDLYLREPETVNTRWLFWRTAQRYFNVGQIAVCFLKLSPETWLLTTIKRVTKELDVYDGINYEGEELEEYRQFYGRVIVKYHKSMQAQGVYYSTVCDELEVLQLLPTTFDGDRKSTRLNSSHKRLSRMPSSA